METTYKFRAECQHDVWAAMALLPLNAGITSLHLVGGKCFPDVIVTISTTELGLKNIRQWLSRVPDGHVMAETVARAEDYTGQRYAA